MAPRRSAAVENDTAVRKVWSAFAVGTCVEFAVLTRAIEVQAEDCADGIENLQDYVRD